MSPRRRPTLEVSGLCTTGHHDKCPGALARPKRRPIGNGLTEPTPVEEHVWYCRCSCHDGKEITVRQDDSVATGRRAKELKKRVRASMAAGLKQDGFIQVPLPDNAEDEKSARSELRAAGSLAGVKLSITTKDGTLRATVRIPKSKPATVTVE